MSKENWQLVTFHCDDPEHTGCIRVMLRSYFLEDEELAESAALYGMIVPARVVGSLELIMQRIWAVGTSHDTVPLRVKVEPHSGMRPVRAEAQSIRMANARAETMLEEQDDPDAESTKNALDELLERLGKAFGEHKRRNTH